MTESFDSQGLLASIQKATDDKLCPNRLWEVGSNLENWKKALPRLLNDSSGTFKAALEHQDHSACTFDFCEYSSRDFTAVSQRHELDSCKEFCFQIKGLFPQSKLIEALSPNGQQLTPWALDGLAILEHPRPFMAISHVWSDGTGNGVWPAGQVNECLYKYFTNIAKRYDCQGIWWDAICIPQDKAARRRALNFMQMNYEFARVTLVHDCFLRKITWPGPEKACFAIIMSPWFSRGWTALELARSRKVKVVFNDCIRDLDADILVDVSNNYAAKAIQYFRNPITSLDQLLHTLGPRHTSWQIDQVIISALLLGIEMPEESKTSNGFQRDLYQKILLHFSSVCYGHLFHNSATMSGAFGWCPTTVFQLPQLAGTDKRNTLTMQPDGSLVGTWKVVSTDAIREEQLIWGISHPLVETVLRYALEDNSLCVLLVEPSANIIDRAVLARPLKNPNIAETPVWGFTFLGALRFQPGITVDGAAYEITIGEKDGWNQWPNTPKSWEALIQDLHALQGNEQNNNVAREISLAPKPWANKMQRWPTLHTFCWIDNSVDYSSFITSTITNGESLIINEVDMLGQTPLHLASERGNIALLRFLLEHGADPNIKTTQDKQTALHRAVLGDSEDIIVLLLRNDNIKADATICDAKRRSALDYAAELGHLRAVTTLLAQMDYVQQLRSAELQNLALCAYKGGNQEVWSYIKMKLNKDWSQACQQLDCGKQLLKIVEGGDGVQIDIFLKSYAQSLATDKWGQMALQVAARHGQTDIALKIMKYGVGGHVSEFNNMTALHVAALSGQTATVWALCKSGIPINTVDTDGATALHIAAYMGHTTVVEALIKKGAAINAKTNNYWLTPLHYAAWTGRTAVIQILIDHGANKEAMAENRLRLYQWHEKNAARRAKLINMREPDLKNIRSVGKVIDNYFDGFTPLHFCVMTGPMSAVQVLLDKGADISVKAFYKETPLHLAASAGQVDVISLLILRGAELEAQTHWAETPLHLAVLEGHASAVETLINGGAYQDAQAYGTYCLAVAARLGLDDILKAILNKGSPISEDHRRQALREAARAGYISAIEILLENQDPVLDILNIESTGRVVLEDAIYAGQSSPVNFLLTKGTLSYAMRPGRDTALHCAAMNGNPEIITALLDGGANIEAKNELEKTPLFIAVYHRHTEAVEILLDRGANIKAVDRDKNSVLHDVFTSAALVRFLLDRGADINAKNSENYTPLHLAIELRRDEIFDTLLDRGADIEAKTVHDDTPLHLAAEETSRYMARRLVEKGANIHARNKSWKKPYKLVDAESKDLRDFLQGKDIALEDDRRVTTFEPFPSDTIAEMELFRRGFPKEPPYINFAKFWETDG